MGVRGIYGCWKHLADQVRAERGREPVVAFAGLVGLSAIEDGAGAALTRAHASLARGLATIG